MDNRKRIMENGKQKMDNSYRAIFFTVFSIIHCPLSILVLFSIIHFPLSICNAQLAYARIVDIDTCNGILTVDRTNGFADNDVVMIHQAFGATVTDKGNLRSLNGAGQWELATIDRIAGTLVFLTSPLDHSYDISCGTQLCKVMHSNNALTVGKLNALPFVDGCGGIVAIKADTLTLTDTIEVKGAGYRGGSRSVSGWDTSCFADNAFFIEGTSGCKGQGPALLDQAHTSGRVHACIGGGGGNARNAGGGGGAGAGNGGRGGLQTSEYEALDVGGEGGDAPTSNQLKDVLLFGGGGGGGHQNDFGASNGANGGGIVLIICNTLVATPNVLLSARGNNADDSFGDGAGGGGGGGTVAIVADTIIDTLRIDVSGGNGGNTFSQYRCYGPGGGGGGGRVVIGEGRGVNGQQSLVSSHWGGGPGVTSGSDAPCTMHSAQSIAYGAEDGDSGAIEIRTIQYEYNTRVCADPDIVVRILDSHARAGEDVDVPLEIEVMRDLSVDVELRMRIRTRATVLMPIGPYWWAGKRSMVRYLNTHVQAGPPRIIPVSLPYRSALGDSASIIVSLDSLECNNKNIRAVVERHGRFTLDGVCFSNNVYRLLDPFEELPTNEVLFFDVLGNIYSNPQESLGSRYPTFKRNRTSVSF